MEQDNTMAVKIVSEAINVLSLIVDKYISKSNFDDCIKCNPDTEYSSILINSIQDLSLKDYLLMPKSIDSFILRFGGDRPENKILRINIQKLRNKFDLFLSENVSKDTFYFEFKVINALIEFWENYLEIYPPKGIGLIGKLQKIVPEKNDQSIPKFKKEAVGQIYNLLRTFFNETQQPLLLALLESGIDPGEYLIFNDNGNKLLDAFRQLNRIDLITQCTRANLERWIGKNFMYQKGEVQKKFTPKYLNDFISTNKECTFPILGIYDLNLSTFI